MTFAERCRNSFVVSKRKMSRCIHILRLVLAAGFLCLSAFGQPEPRLSGQISGDITSSIDKGPPAGQADDLIHFGDLLDVDVIGSTEFDWRGALTPEGFLDGLRFTDNGVYALCETPNSVAEKVADSFKRFLNEPKVNVSILDRSGRATAVIYGAVRTPQRFRLNRPVRLAELLVVSGGLNENARGEIQILRQPLTSCEIRNQVLNGPEADGSGNQERSADDPERNILNIRIENLLTGDKMSNPVISYGDIITVMESLPVYLMGGVANPSRIRFSEGLSVSRAIASAGGLSKEGDARRITVFRRSAGGAEIIKLDLTGVSSPNSDDIVLLPYDIVDVGQKGRAEQKFPPVIDRQSEDAVTNIDLPLRIID